MIQTSPQFSEPDMESHELRRRTMQAVKSNDTAPEMAVRRLAHRMGYRFRLHRKSLPGKPDLVFPRLRKVLFVHGCFWHGHDCPRGRRVPKTNTDYWVRKVAKNRVHDIAVTEQLQTIGWRSLVVWECELKDFPALANRLSLFLASAPSRT